jgi:hypothetical protein
MGNSLPYKDQKPGRAILWRFLNKQQHYLIQFMRLRWSISQAPEISCIFRFERHIASRLCVFTTSFHTERALYILKHLESSSPSILPKLDTFFFTILSETVLYTPYNFTRLNMAIQRCLCLD